MPDDRPFSVDDHYHPNGRVTILRETALQLVHTQLADDRRLHDDAVAAILTDYVHMSAPELLKHLRTYRLILDAFEGRNAFDEMLTLLADLMRAGLHRVDDDALDAVTVQRDALKIEIDDRSTVIGSFSGILLTILSACKENRDIERQLAAVDRLVEDPSDARTKRVARCFRRPADEARSMNRCIQSMFDEQGRFRRSSVEPALDALAEHGNHAFDMLWCTFKTLPGRADRVALLNALQHLIRRIKRPKHALRLLMVDFCRHSGDVHHSDRNAVMLSNMLLRRYNQELDIGIEMTPEEVLNVRNGLDQDIVHYARFRIESMASRFSVKLRTIHGALIEQLGSPAVARRMPPVRHLLFLEREILIFLALLSGGTAHRMLVAALTEYGDPDTGIYRHAGAAIYLPVLLQHLKIIVRGVGRGGSREDVQRLRQIGAQGLKWASIGSTMEQQRSVTRTMAWIDHFVRNISASIWLPT